MLILWVIVYHYISLYFISLSTVCSHSVSEGTLSRDILWICNLLGFLNTHSTFRSFYYFVFQHNAPFFWLFLGILHFLCPSCIKCWFSSTIVSHFLFLHFICSLRDFSYSLSLFLHLYKQSQISILSSQICFLFLSFAN